MQDNHNHIDPGFLDQSWSEMKKLLDREMPARPIPFWRRKGLLWLLLILVPFSATLGFYHFLWKKETQPVPAPAPVQAPVIEKPVASIDTPENCPETSVLPATIDIFIPPTVSPAEPTTPITRITAAGSNEANHAITALAFLPPIPFPNHPTTQSPNCPITQPPNHPTPQPPNHSLTLEAGPFASTGLRSSGFSAGLAISHAFGKSGWGVQSGLGYSYFNNPFPVATLTHNNRAEDFQELEFGPGNTPVNFDTAGSIEAFASSADSTVSHLHYLDIPLALTRQLGKRWQVQAGAGLSLLLASRTETGDDAGYGLVSGRQAGMTDDQVTGGFSGADAAAVLSRLRIANPSLQAGIAFFPHPNWSIGLQINAAMRDAMPDWPGRQFLNKAQLKLGYRF